MRVRWTWVVAAVIVAAAGVVRAQAPVTGPAGDCIGFRSPPRLAAGAPFTAPLKWGLDLPRHIRFVTSQADYDAARNAIDGRDAGAALKLMDELGRGRLTLTITDSRVRQVTLPDGRAGDAFDWIAFSGDACVGSLSAADPAPPRPTWTDDEEARLPGRMRR